MAHVALGTDSPHRLPLLQLTGITCSVFGDLRDDRTTIVPERALEWITLAGARALGLQEQIGSLEVGKRADVAVFEVSRPLHNVANALVHHAVSGRAVHVFIDGEHVVCDGHVSDEDKIVSEAIQVGLRLASRAGFPLWTGWPLIE
jgi:5-methylthioadenosine/S-adenosylhomocysteine deaminase